MSRHETENSGARTTSGNEMDLARAIAFDAVEKADSAAGKFHLPEAVGISGKDYTLFSYYMAQRFLRTSIYDSSFLLSRPGTSVMTRIPLIGKLAHFIDRYDRATRAALTALE